MDSIFSRRYRNRRIGDFLKELHLTEGRNTGLRKIVNAMKRNGSPEPIFEIGPEYTAFITTLPIHSYFLKNKPDELNDPVRDPNDPNHAPNTIRLPINELAILNVIKSDASLSYRQMSEILDVSPATVKRGIKSLRDRNIIQRTGTTRKGTWLINGEENLK